MTSVECGAACLAMILSYFGRKTRISECRDSCGAGRDGVTARAMARAARHHGLRVKAFSLAPADFRDVPLPAIAHWDHNHFVVVERWSPQAVVIVDPTAGRRRLTAEEFAAGFAGVALTLEPDVHFERRRAAARSEWRRYLKLLVSTPGTAGLLARVLGASLVLQALGLALPAFIVVLVDRVLPLRNAEMMPILGLGVLVLALTQMVAGYLRATRLIDLQARLDARMMGGFFEHMLALPLHFFQQRSSGDLHARLASFATIRELLTGRALSAALDGGLVLVYLAIVWAGHPALGALTLGIGTLQVTLLLGTTRRMQGLTQRHLAAQAKTQGYMVEALKGVASVKASGGEARILDRWSGLFSCQLNLARQRGRMSALLETALMTLRTAAPLILLWAGAQEVLRGTLSPGAMLALTALATSALAPLASLVSAGQQWPMVGVHLERVADVAEAEPEPHRQGVRPAPPLTGRIELRRVGFRYDAHAPLVLRDLSVTVAAGQKVALVGRTGSGKSTLALLLLGLHTPSEGEILYDGIPARRLDSRMLRSRCGAVLQEASWFSGSIRQIIAAGDPDLPFECVVEAARLAAIHDEVVRMPMGYETLVAEGGGGLSGGQRQRLALARALAHRPAFLVLDEATSHLDGITERLVERNLGRLSCTRIVIAGRLSTIEDADQILVLEEGTIIERGSHADLLAWGGLYAGLVRGQHARVEVTDRSAPAIAGGRLELGSIGPSRTGRDHRGRL